MARNSHSGNRARAVLIILLLADVFLLVLLRGRAASQRAEALPPTASLLITLGEKAHGPEKWDGSLSILGGEPGELEGRHFTATDAITGSGSWRASVRADAVAPYPDLHYTEMRPGSIPPVLYHPTGIYASARETSNARFTVATVQGNFEFALNEVGVNPKPFLNGRATVARVPSASKLTDSSYENDEPALAALPDGGMAVAWVAYRDRADRVLLRVFEAGAWTAPEQVSPDPGDIFRTALALDKEGLWAFWTEREGERWNLWARRRLHGVWEKAARLTAQGSNTFVRAVSAPDSSVFVVWQSLRETQSDIFLKAFRDGKWSADIQVSESSANDWEPAVAAGADGTAYIAWDTYDKGNFDVAMRSWRDGSLSPLNLVTRGPQFQAHASVAVDGQNRPWIAWDESGVNWGKDQGFLIPTPLASPLHKQRNVHLAVWDGARWLEPVPALQPVAAWGESFRENAEHPQMAFDGSGGLVLLFRHWTRQNSRAIGSPIDWENYLTRLDGQAWTTPVPLEHSAGSIEKHPALTRTSDGSVHAAWMTDNRPFGTQVPTHAHIYHADLGQGGAANWSSELQHFIEAMPEAIPLHSHEAEDVRAARSWVTAVSGQNYRIFRGEMHRHSDVSQDFKYDGSLIEIYRYAMDVASFDYIAVTDHQAGYDQEFTWWQNQKLAHLFLMPGVFTPLFAYERSVPYPNGHRNVIFAHPGVRTLPIPPEELSGKVGAAKLYAYLHLNNGISMPHSTATDQGTDWRDNDPQVEPLMEIYQGYRTSYEYEGAPRSATTDNPQAQKSGWEPKGFLWNALAKGYKLGVEASSDHWSTHISYACLLAERFTREGLLDAIRKRHAYGATDNIALDVRASADGRTWLMGDIIHSRTAPRLSVRVGGTGSIKRIDIVKNGRFVYNARPNASRATLEYVDRDFRAEEAWYYVRVLQEDGQLAWSSPIWVEPE